MDNRKTYAEEIMQKIKDTEKADQQDIYGIENDIHNGFIVVKYQKMDIEEKELLGGEIMMRMPAEFTIMDEELAETKYPGEDKPDYIYTNEDTTVNLTFTLDDNGQIGNDEVEEVKNILAQQIQRLYPGSKIEDSQMIQAGEKSIGLFSLDVPLIDGDLYNVMFFMAIKGRLLMGSFNSNIYQKKQWRPVVQQMLMSIREIQQTDEPNLGNR